MAFLHASVRDHQPFFSSFFLVLFSFFFPEKGSVVRNKVDEGCAGCGEGGCGCDDGGGGGVVVVVGVVVMVVVVVVMVMVVEGWVRGAGVVKEKKRDSLCYYNSAARCVWCVCVHTQEQNN